VVVAEEFLIMEPFFKVILEFTYMFYFSYYWLELLWECPCFLCLRYCDICYMAHVVGYISFLRTSEHDNIACGLLLIFHFL